MAVEIELLKSTPYFSGLSTPELEAIKEHVFEEAAERNDMILLEEEPANAVYFVVSGVVKVFKTSVEGKEQVLCIVKPGESFNDVAVFDGGPNPASAIAMTPAVLYGIAKADMETILREHPNLAYNVIKILSKKVRYFVSLVEDFSFRNVTDRLAKLLLEYATDHAWSGEEAGHRPRLTQQDMAAMVGTAREVVGRSLKALEDEGAIRMDRHRIVVVNKKTLEKMSGLVGG
jgi:CRP-like cAMP-binding protein